MKNKHEGHELVVQQRVWMEYPVKGVEEGKNGILLVKIEWEQGEDAGEDVEEHFWCNTCQQGVVAGDFDMDFWEVW